MVSERGSERDDRPDKGYTAFTPELAKWLPAKVELVERAASKRPGVFLESFDLESTGGREVLTVCCEIAEWTGDECQAFFDGQNLSTGDKWIAYDVDEKRWKTMIARLTSFLPKTSIEESAEAQLMATVQDNHESLMQFAGRYQSQAVKLISNKKIEEARATLILVAKLPAHLQQKMRVICGKERKLTSVVEGVVNDQNWETELTAISKTFPKPVTITNDAMQICDLSEEDDEQAIFLNNIRDELFDGDQIRYEQVKTPNHVMILAKHLIQKHSRYRREMTRFLKTTGSDDAHTRPKSGPARMDPQIQYLSVPDDHEDPMGVEVPHFGALRPSPKPRPLIKCSVEMAGKKIDAVIDTGASCSFVQESLLKAMGLLEEVFYVPGTAELGDGSIGRTEGLISLVVKIGDKKHHVDAFVMRGKGSPLILGLDYTDEADVLIYTRKRMLVDAKDGAAIVPDASAIQCHALSTGGKNEIPAPLTPGQC